MRKKTSAPATSNVHTFSSSGAIKKTQIEGGKLSAPPVKKPKPVVKPKIKTSGSKGVRVGTINDLSKWRCAVCKHVNEEWDDSCRTCKEPKTVLEPEKVKKPHEEIKKKMPPKKEKPKMMTFQDLGPHPENLGAAKVPKKLPDTEDEALRVSSVVINVIQQKLAKDKPTKIDTIGKMKQKEQMAKLRDPAKFNAEIFSKEYGGSLQQIFQ
eukprot:TRINITY_DN1269_c0_g1_i2.p3 TRINITY_DN1269_c0_g1~~TRINITY_DN1269_c0_g1_i2.p3  ORF type:complete len:244 (+),score=17.53 TRINITY_DN1269_c0_g1_i2:103-732(+)